MRMEVEVLPESMNGHNDTGHALGLIQGGAHHVAYTLVCDPAEVFEQVAVVTEVRAQHFRVNVLAKLPHRFRSPQKPCPWIP